MLPNTPSLPGQLPRELAQKVDSLIQAFDDASVMTDGQIERRIAEHMRRAVPKMVGDGLNFGEASGEPGFFNQDEASFREFMKKVDQDLGWQCDTVADSFRRFRARGLVPAPHYPMRIAILLRKAKEHEREKRFLRAWCRHFPTGNGVKYGKLVERARKLGVIREEPVRRQPHVDNSAAKPRVPLSSGRATKTVLSFATAAVIVAALFLWL